MLLKMFTLAPVEGTWKKGTHSSPSPPTGRGSAALSRASSCMNRSLERRQERSSSSFWLPLREGGGEGGVRGGMGEQGVAFHPFVLDLTFGA